MKEKENEYSFMPEDGEDAFVNVCEGIVKNIELTDLVNKRIETKDNLTFGRRDVNEYGKQIAKHLKEFDRMFIEVPNPNES